MTRLGLIVIAALATSTRAWPRLEEALKNYPSIHARETANLKAGQPAKFVLVVCYLTHASPRARSRRNAMSGAEFEEREAELLTVGARRHDVEDFKERHGSVRPRAGARLFRRDCERVESPVTVNPALTAC